MIIHVEQSSICTVDFLLLLLFTKSMVRTTTYDVIRYEVIHPNMRVTIRGTVQGVGFRPAVYRAAERVGASGTVQNDGSSVIIDSDRTDQLLVELMSDLPPLAKVTSIQREYVPYRGPPGFSIIPSSGSGSGASIPADSTMCDKCVEEIFSMGRRHLYPFTTCTDCGPRFTLLRKMPYDRPLTSMDGFPMCPDCAREFLDPKNRRFHHQTICCPRCGPSYWLETSDGRVFIDNPIRRLAELLDSGRKAVVKGWGGMHICCILDVLPEMREWYNRRNKPFAIMARDMEAVRRYALPTANEAEALRSPERPIVLVRKRTTEVAELASPGLDNIGMFLPYTGMHHILFSWLEHDALVMTSANVPGEPMAIKNDEARRLGADACLFHDQPIINRADDTVLRIFDDRRQYIRRSRGSIPFGLEIRINGDVVALGAQENLSGSVASNGVIWPTQYIGNGEKVGVPEYLEEAVKTQMSLIGCHPDVVAIDLHPGYANRRFGRALAEEYGAELMEVQHHWTHAASLMADVGIDGCACLALDGTGHGDDGTTWGGEVLCADLSGYKRAAHLECIPLLGSEKALYDLRRLKFAIDEMNGAENHDFPDRDAAVLRKLMGTSIRTSSMGRVLDALSFSLGVCRERTYDGEPAMKLEPLLARGRLIDGFETETENGVIRTAHLFERLGRGRPEDEAYSIVYNLMTELVQSSISAADSAGYKYIGLTGGVSYNRVVSRMFKDMVISSDHLPAIHGKVPNGDCGISVGQAAIALRRIQ